MSEIVVGLSLARIDEGDSESVLCLLGQIEERLDGTIVYNCHKENTKDVGQYGKLNFFFANNPDVTNITTDWLKKHKDTDIRMRLRLTSTELVISVNYYDTQTQEVKKEDFFVIVET